MTSINDEIDNENPFKFKSILDNDIPNDYSIFDMVNEDGLSILHLCT